jgi:signal transduction histidine kinase
MVVPVRYRGRTLGTITASRGDGQISYGEADLAFLRQLADRAASALEHARLFREERAARDAAEQAVRVRDEFLAIASHELRTPLTALLLQVQAAERGAGESAADRGTPPDPRLIKRLAGAAHSALRLSRSIDDLLDVTRLSAGGPDLEPTDVDLAELAASVAARFASAAEAAGCVLDVDAPAPVRGRWDRSRLEQVIGNLLANATKYGPGQPVDVIARGNGSVAELVVRDRGMGIDPADHVRIFGRFERAVPARNYGGFGLGLWIAKRIVEASGGEIFVESAPGAGATFTVRLPIPTA